MLEVKIENIVSVPEARDDLEKCVDQVNGSDELFVITKNGKPAAIIVGVHHLEKLTGIDHKQFSDEEDKEAVASSLDAVAMNNVEANSTPANNPIELNNADLTPSFEPESNSEPLTSPDWNIDADQTTPAAPLESVGDNNDWLQKDSTPISGAATPVQPSPMSDIASTPTQQEVNDSWDISLPSEPETTVSNTVQTPVESDKDDFILPPLDEDVEKQPETPIAPATPVNNQNTNATNTTPPASPFGQADF